MIGGRDLTAAARLSDGATATRHAWNRASHRSSHDCRDVAIRSGVSLDRAVSFGLREVVIQRDTVARCVAGRKPAAPMQSA